MAAGSHPAARPLDSLPADHLDGLPYRGCTLLSRLNLEGDGVSPVLAAAHIANDVGLYGPDDAGDDQVGL